MDSKVETTQESTEYYIEVLVGALVQGKLKPLKTSQDFFEVNVEGGLWVPFFQSDLRSEAQVFYGEMINPSANRKYIEPVIGLTRPVRLLEITFSPDRSEILKGELLAMHVPVTEALVAKGVR